MSNWYPSANSWEDKGSYQVKHKFDDTGYTTYLIMTFARFLMGRDLSGKCDRDYCKFG